MWCLPAGVVAGVFLAFDWAPWWPIFIPVAMVAGRSRRRVLVALLLFCAGLLHGAVAVALAVDSRLPATLSDRVLTLSGRVLDLPDSRRVTGWGHDLWQTTFLFGIEGERPWPGARRLRLTHTGEFPPGIQVGDELRLAVRVREPRGLVNEAAFDAERFWLARGVQALGRVEAVLDHRAAAGPVDRWRTGLASRLRGNGARPADAVLPALAAGDRRGLDAGHWQVLQQTGTAHLIAISGLHISLVAGAVWFLTRWLLAAGLAGGSGRTVAARLAVLPAIGAATGYAALAGFSLPTCRALFMAALVLGAVLAGRGSGRWSVLGLALSALLLADPLAALETGFWLSFLAVALLAASTGPDRAGLLRLQLLLSLGTGAVVAWMMGAWSLGAIPANLLLVPLYSLLVIPLTLVGGILPGLDVAIDVAAFLVDLGWRFLELMAALAPLPSVTSLAVAGLILAALLRWSVPWWPGPARACVLLLVPWLWPQLEPPKPGEFELVMFDVGQGQMTAVRTRHHLVLYDTGPVWQEGSAVSAILVPWLDRHRLVPDLAFVSHGDDDHDGGRRDLARLWPALPVLGGEPERTGTFPCLAGQRWQLDGVLLEVLWPVRVPLRHSNNHSCVVRVSGRHGSVLLTGDVEHPVEFELARREVRADLLQVPHHGSATSSSHSFIRSVSPRLALVAAGHGNRFGHPHPDVVARYQSFGVPLWSTAETGMQVVRFAAPDGMKTAAWRRDSRAPWRFPAPVLE